MLRDKECVVALRPYQRVIVMHLLHYIDDIRPVDEISELKDIQHTVLIAKNYHWENCWLKTYLVGTLTQANIQMPMLKN